MNYKKIIIGLLLTAVCSISVGQEMLDKIVAVVEREAITQRELSRNLILTKQMLSQQNQPLPNEQALLAQVLQQLITKKLQLQEADRLGIKIDEITLDRTLQAMAKENKMSLAELRYKVEQQGQSFKTLRENVRENLTIKQVVQIEVIDQIEVSEQEIKNFIIAKSNALNEDLTYHFAYISIKLPNDGEEKKHIKSRALSIHKNLNKENISNFGLLKKRTAEIWGTTDSKQKQTETSDINYHVVDMGWKPIKELPSPVHERLHTVSVGQQLPPISNKQAIYLFHLLAIQSGEQTIMQKEYHIHHILIQTTPLDDDTVIKTKLNRIKAYLEKGGDFAKAADRYSQDPGSAFKGGDLDWNSLENFDPAFAEVATLAAQTENKIYGPFQTRFGWHILKVTGVREENISNQETRNIAVSRIKQSKLNDEVRLWLLRLRENRHIEIFL